MHGEIGAQKVGIDVDARAVDKHERVLEEDGRAKGADHGGKASRMAQGPVGHALEQIADDGHEHGHHDADQKDCGEGGKDACQVAAHKQGQAQIGTDGEQVAVSEVDELENTVDHGVAQGHECVDATDGESVEKLLKEEFHDFGGDGTGGG